MNYLPMTSVIDLYVLEQIFGTSKISGQTKAIYINCLMHHFSKLPALEVHACQFSIGYELAQFKKFAKHYDEMKHHSLVSYSDKELVFIPHWNRYIDKTRFGKTEYKTKAGIDQYIEALKSNSVIDLVAMRIRVSREDVLTLCDLFAMEKQSLGSEYEDLSSVVQHFMFWSSKPVNKELIVKEKKTVVSKAKEL